MSKIKIKEQTLEGIANAIRAKDGTEEPIPVPDYEERIRAIPQDASVEDVQINGTSIVDENNVANIPIAGTNALGVVIISYGGGLQIGSNGGISVKRATATEIKTGTNQYAPVTPNNVKEATFYGMAKAAGDTTQTQSSNPVGTYTDEAIVKILSMLGIVMISQTDYDALPIKEQKLYLIYGGNS